MSVGFIEFIYKKPIVTTLALSLKVLFFCDETVSSLKVLLVMPLATNLNFITNSMTSSTFSDETVLSQKKKELLVMKKFVPVDPFVSRPPFLFGALNLAYPIVTESKFCH